MADVAELRRLLTSVAWHSWEAHDDGTASCRIDLPMAGVRSAAEAEAAIREVANALPALLGVAEAAEPLSVADRAHQCRAADDDEGNAAFDADARAALWDTLCDAWCDFRAKLAALPAHKED